MADRSSTFRRSPYQTALAHKDRVLAAERLGVIARTLWRFDQRTQADECPDVGWGGRAFQVLDDSRRIKSSSSLKGSGSLLRFWRGVSVVPIMTLPSHGTVNNTRPSDVPGMISA